MPSITRLPLAAAFAALTLALSACSQGENPSPGESQTAQPEIEIANPRLVLPAVSGNPAAGYFELTNNSDQVAVLTGVDVAQANKSELHETSGNAMVRLPSVAIQPGEQIVFAPGGKHVMVFGPPAAAAGSAVTMTFKFENGRKQTAEAKVETAGGASTDDAGHSGMDMH